MSCTREVWQLRHREWHLGGCMGRDVPTGETTGQQAAKARRRSRGQGDASQVAVTQGWAKREKVADPFIEAVRQKIDDEIYMHDVVRDTKHLHASEMCK